MLEQRWPGDADIGSGDDDAVDVTSNPAAGGDEAELLAVASVGAEVEACSPEPSDRERLELVTDVEDAQRSAIEALVGIDRRMHHLVHQLAGARLADPAAAEVVARLLLRMTIEQRPIDQAVDALANSPLRRGCVDGAASRD